MKRYTSTQYQAKKPNAEGLIEYSEGENRVWRDLYQAQIGLVNRHMAKKFLEGLAIIDLPKQRIPQCGEVSERLQKLTGWQVVPVPALIAYDRFFGMLANKQFPAASFIRTQEDFWYVKEPDIFHEIFGHGPLLTLPQITEFSQKLGELALTVDPSFHVWLARIYWFTVEFGMIKQGDDIVPLGSGLASSPSELLHAVESNDIILKPFELIEVLRTPYRIDIKQPIYYFLEDLDQLQSITDSDIISAVKYAQSLGLKTAHPLLQKAS